MRNLRQAWLYNFYPRPPRGGRHKDREPERDRLEISIHALREEGDQFLSNNREDRIISIHALREEGDLRVSHITIANKSFLSTPSARRATESGRSLCCL